MIVTWSDRSHHARQFDEEWMGSDALPDRYEEPKGFCVTLPHVNEAIRPIHGRLTSWGRPIGWVTLLRGMPSVRTARMAVLGILPAFRKRAIAERMIRRAFQHGNNKLEYSGAEHGWMLEDNCLGSAGIGIRVAGVRHVECCSGSAGVLLVAVRSAADARFMSTDMLGRQIDYSHHG